MVTVNLDKQGINGHILLEPNQSMNWKENLNTLIVFCFLTVLVAIYFLLNGKWLVLPFSGLEILVFFICLYIYFNKNRYCEVIRFTSDNVIIEQGKKSAESIKSYKRLWSKFYIEPSSSLSMPRIFIRFQDQETEIGSFLNYDDKQQLINTLKIIINNYKN